MAEQVAASIAILRRKQRDEASRASIDLEPLTGVKEAEADLSPPPPLQSELPNGRKYIVIGDSLVRNTGALINKEGNFVRLRGCLSGAAVGKIIGVALKLSGQEDSVSHLII